MQDTWPKLEGVSREQRIAVLSDALSRIEQSTKEEVVRMAEDLKVMPPYPNASNGWRKELNEEEKNYNQALSDLIQAIKENHAPN